MSDRRFVARTRDGAPEFAAHELAATDQLPAGARPGDFVVDEHGPSSHAERHDPVWPRERFLDTYVAVEEENTAAAAAPAANSNRDTVVDGALEGLASRVDSIDARLKALETANVKPAAEAAAPAGEKPE